MKPFYIHENSDYHKQLRIPAYKVLFSSMLQRSISVAPITQVTLVRNKNSNIQGRSLNVIKMIFHSTRKERKDFFLLKFWMYAFARFFSLAISVKSLQSV